MENQKIKSDENNTIGKNIREARQKLNIGQTEMVSRLQLLDIKMTRETLVKIETKLSSKHVFSFYPKCDFGPSFMTGST